MAVAGTSALKQRLSRNNAKRNASAHINLVQCHEVISPGVIQDGAFMLLMLFKTFGTRAWWENGVSRNLSESTWSNGAHRRVSHLG